MEKVIHDETIVNVDDKMMKYKTPTCEYSV